VLNEQIDAFATPPAAAAPHSPRVSRQQRAKEAGELGSQRAEDRAMTKDPTFSARARAAVIAYLTEHGATSGETITDAIKSGGIRPPDDRAFGNVYRLLARDNLIRCIGTCIRLKGNHTAGGRVWELT
jgi:hypothetical protein